MYDPLSASMLIDLTEALARVGVGGRAFGQKPARVVEYEDLDAMSDDLIDNLLASNDIILLYPAAPESGSHVGHWVALLKRGNRLEYYDSQGAFPDSIITARKGRKNGVHPRLLLYIDQAMRKGVDAHYNQHQHQRDDTSTCGRHVALRLAHGDMTCDEYNSALTSLARDLGTSADAAAYVVTQSSS